MSANVIAIDGPAYVGKSQIAQTLAKELGYTFINTGHMYRAMARRAIELGVSPTDETALLKMPFEIWFFNGSTLVSDGAPVGGAWDWTRKLERHGANWTNELDQVNFVRLASEIAKLPKVRECFTRIQRSYARNSWVVMEGRDIGTVVFPDAAWKFFVTASEEVRARRLLKMTLPEKRPPIDYAAALEKIRAFDDSDTNRKIAPLRKAEDAIEYDNSDSPSAREDAEELLNCIKNGREKAPRNLVYGIHR